MRGEEDISVRSSNMTKCIELGEEVVMAVYTPTSGIGQVLHLVGAGLSQIGRLFR